MTCAGQRVAPNPSGKPQGSPRGIRTRGWWFALAPGLHKSSLSCLFFHNNSILSAYAELHRSHADAKSGSPHNVKSLTSWRHYCDRFSLIKTQRSAHCQGL